MKVGDKFWSFDRNKRQYEGKGSGAKSIYRAHFFPVGIIGETSRSWSIGHFGISRPIELFKVPKSNPFREKYGEFGTRLIILTDQMVDDECWDEKHRYKISRQIDKIDLPTLREVAKLIGYKEEA